MKVWVYLILALIAGALSGWAAIQDDYAKASYHLIGFWIFYRLSTEGAKEGE